MSSRRQVRTKKRRLVDLFSGTGSVAKEAKKLGYDVRALDMNDHPHVDYVSDIMKFDYKTEFSSWVPDVIWASPPCTHYSRAKTWGERDLVSANKIVRRVFKIIDWVMTNLNPNLIFVVENPQTGLLKDQTFMRRIPYVDADYCCYGFPYRKRTRFWTNSSLAEEEDLGLCPGAESCKQMKDGRHLRSCGDGTMWKYGPTLRQEEKYPIPPRLVRKLVHPDLIP